MGKYIEVQILDLIEEQKKEIIDAFTRGKEQVVKNQISGKVQAREVRTIQKTLGGSLVSAIPKVRTTDGHLMDWDRNTIVKQLLKETKLSEQFYGKESITEQEAKEIAKETEKRIKDMGVKFPLGPTCSRTCQYNTS